MQENRKPELSISIQLYKLKAYEIFTCAEHHRFVRLYAVYPAFIPCRHIAVNGRMQYIHKGIRFYPVYVYPDPGALVGTPEYLKLYGGKSDIAIYPDNRSDLFPLDGRVSEPGTGKSFTGKFHLFRAPGNHQHTINCIYPRRKHHRKISFLTDKIPGFRHVYIFNLIR